MRYQRSVSFLFCVLTMALHAQVKEPPSKAELAAITERGRLLAEYDAAAWQATDAVLAMKPPERSVTGYLAKKGANGWEVVFGGLSEKRDKFLIHYEATQRKDQKNFQVKLYDKPREDQDFYLFAAKGIELVLADFKGEDRRYNLAVLPAESKQMYVYIVPAQTIQDTFPLGGDARYLLSEDGSKIIEKRQLHKTIVDFVPPTDGKPLDSGYHTAVMDNIPEDTDVLHVLVRKPSIPEYITTKLFFYIIDANGQVNYVSTMDEFLKPKTPE
jgi:hypothetical protein